MKTQAQLKREDRAIRLELQAARLAFRRRQSVMVLASGLLSMVAGIVTLVCVFSAFVK